MSSDGAADGGSKTFPEEPTANIRVPRSRSATPPTPVDVHPISRQTDEITDVDEGANQRVADLHITLESGSDIPGPVAAAVAGRLLLQTKPTRRLRLGSEGVVGSPIANGTDSAIALTADQTASLARTDITTPHVRSPWRDVVLGVTLGVVLLAAGVAAASYLL